MSQSKKIGNTTIQWAIGDLTDLDIEAFVFYAQNNLELGSGFGNAISTRGGPSIKKELQEIGNLDPNQAIISSAGNLKADYIIHVNGPKFQEQDTESKLKTAMLNVLRIAEEKGIKRLAFPAMGTGFYGVPRPLSAKIMHDCLKEYLGNGSMIEEVVICLLENREFAAFSTEFDTN